VPFSVALLHEGFAPVAALGAALAIPVSAGFFSMLGVQAQYGRVFEPRDAAGGCAVVVSYAYWRDQLGADKTAPGRALTLDQRAWVFENGRVLKRPTGVSPDLDGAAAALGRQQRTATNQSQSEAAKPRRQSPRWLRKVFC